MKAIALIFMTSLIYVGNIVDQQQIIAHRGFSSQAPENTLSAFQLAIESGADYLELDVHKSKDDSVIVIHDKSIDRTCSNGMKGNILDMSYDELRKVRVGYSSRFGNKFENEKIPTLYQALKLCKGKIKVCIEIKALSLENSVLDCIQRLGMQKEVIIFSFHKEVLQNIRRVDKEIPILFLKTKATKSTITEAKDLGAQAIGVGPLTAINKGFLEEARHHKIMVWRWTVDKEDKIEKYLKKGVDGIITNRPDVAIALRTKGNN